MRPIIQIARNIVPRHICQGNLNQWNQIRGMRMFREKTLRVMYWRGRSFDAVKFDRRRSEWQDWNYKTEIFAFSRRLQENLSEDTLRCLLTHPSFIKELEKREESLHLPNSNLESNENLVARGEKLLIDCIKPYLRYHFTRIPEDGIIAITEYLTSPPVMADMAKWFGCKEIVLASEYPPSEETMSRTVSALVGGVEKDLGIERTRRFITDMVITYINDKDLLDDVWNIPNPKETLNHILVNSRLQPYEPRIVFQTGLRTIEACHVVGLYTSKNFLGSSAGETLEIAEECACLDALRRLFDLGDHRRPLTYGEKSEKIDYSAHTKEHDYIKSWKIHPN